MRRLAFHAGHGVVHEYVDAIGREMVRHQPRCCVGIQQRPADKIRPLHDGDALDAHLVQRARQLQSQDAAADDERAPAAAEPVFDLPCVGPGAEGEGLIQPFHRVHVGARAGGDEEFVVG